MSKWKYIDKTEIINEELVVHRLFTLDNSSTGQKFIQFKSGSSSEFSSNDSGSYWDSSRINFYLSGSQFHFSSVTSSYEAGNKFTGLSHAFFEKNTINPTYTHKFHSTGSTLSISQYYFGDKIQKKSFQLTDNSHPSGTVVIIDDGYGNLYAPSASISSSGDTSISSSDNYVGNISYNLGIINITETGSFSHTPSTASITFQNIISHSNEFHISSSDLSTTFKFMANSGSLTGSDDTNLFYFESASGHADVTRSLQVSAASASKKVNNVFSLNSPSGSYISSSVQNTGNPVLILTNVNKPNRPIHNIDNLPPITASLGNIGYVVSGFGGGTAPVNYTSVGTGLDGGIGSGSYIIGFNSTHIINTKEYSLKIGKKDFNYTTNPSVKRFGTTFNTAASSSLDSSPYIKDDILSSSLSGSWGPMMTTVGLYRQHADGTMDTKPIMVARYPQPIMIRKDIDLILKIRIDI